MKKILFSLVFLGAAMGLSGSPLLFESYQKDPVSIKPNIQDTVTAVGVSFSTDTTAYVQFTAGGLNSLSTLWLELDGEPLPVIAQSNIAPAYRDGFSISYSYLLTSGNHNLSLVFTPYETDGWPAVCQNAYLQALIFLPDSASGVAEQPEPGQASPVTSAVISRGPYVSAPGASMVVDASGRVMENVLTEGKVQISSLPAGTYYAKDKDRTVVKIVKVD